MGQKNVENYYKKEIENTEREKGFGRHSRSSVYSLGSQQQQQQQK